MKQTKLSNWWILWIALAFAAAFVVCEAVDYLRDREFFRTARERGIPLPRRNIFQDLAR